MTSGSSPGDPDAEEGDGLDGSISRDPLPETPAPVDGAPGAGPAHGDPPPPPTSSTAGMGRRAARGAAVTAAGQGGRMTLQLLSVVVLARLLDPTDYGLLAMVVVVVGVGEIFRDFGLSSASVQARELTRAQRDNLFWVNTAIGAALTGLLAASGGLLAAVYQREELVGIAQAVAVTFLLNGVATQHRAGLLRSLRFARLATIEIVAPAVALVVAISVAVAGAGYWALVAQVVTQSALMAAGMILAGRWLPGPPRRRVGTRPLLRFGGRLVGTQLISYAGNNTDTLVVGLRLGATDLGLYNRAFQLLMTPLNQLRGPTTTIALPVLSRLQDEVDRFGEYVRRGQLALGYSLVVGLAVLVAAARPLTDLLLGPGWEGVTPLLRLLAVAGALQTLSYVGYWVYLARGLTQDLLRYTLLTTSIKITAVLVGSLWGLVGVAAGYAAAPAVAWPLSLWWLSRRTTIPTRALLLGGGRVLLVACTVAATAFAAVQLAAVAPVALQVLSAALGGAAGLGVACLAGAVRQDLRDLLEMIRLVRHR